MMARMDWEKRRRKQIVNERGPLPWWKRAWKPTIRPATQSSPRVIRAKALGSARERAGALPGSAQRRVAGVETRVREVERRGGDVRVDFAVGMRFAYRNKRGRVMEHRIVRIALGRAYTDDHKKFKIRTLRKLSQGPSPVVRVL
jgi:hypothetical protein